MCAGVGGYEVTLTYTGPHAACYSSDVPQPESPPAQKAEGDWSGGKSMNIIMVGCEFAGKTTLADLIVEWCERNLGGSSHFHDHFTIPSSELTGQAYEEYRVAHPQIKEMLQRFMISYHVSESFYGNPDHNLMGAHIEEAVYAPLYYGYGGKNSEVPSRSSEGQRSEMARDFEEEILERAPECVLVLVEAAPEVIRERMGANSWPDGETVAAQRRSKPFGEPTRGVVREKDVEMVLGRFREEFAASLIRNKMVLDTTSATPEESLAEFVEKMEPFLTGADRQRMEGQRN